MAVLGNDLPVDRPAPDPMHDAVVEGDAEKLTTGLPHLFDRCVTPRAESSGTGDAHDRHPKSPATDEPASRLEALELDAAPRPCIRGGTRKICVSKLEVPQVGRTPVEHQHAGYIDEIR